VRETEIAAVAWHKSSLITLNTGCFSPLSLISLKHYSAVSIPFWSSSKAVIFTMVRNIEKAVISGVAS
jgi:hypothetical protein